MKMKYFGYCTFSIGYWRFNYQYEFPIKIRNQKQPNYGEYFKAFPQRRNQKGAFRDNGCRPQWFLKIDILCTEESFPEFSGK